MKKQNLKEGIVDAIYKLLSKGKYNVAQKNFKDSPEVKRAIKKSEDARKELIKSLDNLKKHKTKKTDFKSRFLKKYGR